MQWYAVLFYCLLLLAGFYTVSHHSASTPAEALVMLGAVGLWRYAWLLLSLVRAAWYQHRVYPRWQQAFPKNYQPPVFIVLCSYQTPAAITSRVMTHLATAIAAYPEPVTLFLAATDAKEAAHMAGELRRSGLPPSCRLWLFGQNGCGKRTALASGLRAIAAHRPSEDSVTILMDGDTLLPPDALKRSTAALNPQNGASAVTVQNSMECAGYRWLQAWYALRAAQRHVLMCAQSLSDRLLVLTGRFSAFRTHGIIAPDFIHTLQYDTHYHWQYGRLRLITGDDKTTWLSALQRGWCLRYLPDVAVTTLEIAPRAGFFRSTVTLQRRWFGNSLRVNGLALHLSWKRIPLYTWWSLVDQRLSMWTSLLGPTTIAAMLVIDPNPAVLGSYVVWVLITRGLHSLLLYCLDGRWHAAFIGLLFYNQVVGSLLKIDCFFHCYQQSWSRQRLPVDRAAWYSPIRRFVPFTASLRQLNAALLFLCAVVWLIS